MTMQRSCSKNGTVAIDGLKGLIQGRKSFCKFWLRAKYFSSAHI